MRVQRPLDLVFAVRLGGVVGALVEGFKLIVADSGNAESTASGALEGEEGARRASN